MRSTSLAIRQQTIPAFGAVAIEDTRIVGVRVANSASGRSMLTVIARGGVATFMTQSDCPLHRLADDHIFEVTTPLNVDAQLAEAIEMKLLEWAADERVVRLDWERRPSTGALDPGPDYVRIWPSESGSAPLVIRRPAAVLPRVAGTRRRTLSLA